MHLPIVPTVHFEVNINFLCFICQNYSHESIQQQINSLSIYLGELISYLNLNWAENRASKKPRSLCRYTLHHLLCWIGRIVHFHHLYIKALVLYNYWTEFLSIWIVLALMFLWILTCWGIDNSIIFSLIYCYCYCIIFDNKLCLSDAWFTYY